MTKLTILSALLTLVLGQSAAPFLQSQEFDIELAKSGKQFLETYCKRCHGDDEKYPGLDVLDRQTLLSPLDESEEPFIVAGEPDESRLGESVDSDYMPPEKQLQPSAEDKAVFERWIKEGAHFPPGQRQKRPFLGDRTILSLIADDIAKLPEQKIPYVRYFSLAHLWNNTEGDDPTTLEDMRTGRAALSKLVNSLSNRPRITIPRVVDEETQVLLAIDMRDYGWNEWGWNAVIRRYPYGLKIGGPVAARVYRETGTKIPYVRADWFITYASRPPLYHSLLSIPQNAKQLEHDLGVDIYQNFIDGNLHRAAFENSEVSDQNRLLERHDTNRAGGYYWKSYDISPGTEELGDFSRRPLGPKFEKHEGRQLAAFVHDGGEIIWSLENGLQGYMLVDGQDQRLDVGPDDIVIDPNQHSGTFRILNGISCIGCHKHGMMRWKRDEVRELFQPLEGQAVADKVLELFPPNQEMQELVAADEEKFLAALEKAVGPFLRDGEDDQRSIKDFVDPVTRVTRLYQRNVDLYDAARELGLPLTDAEAEKLGMKSLADLKVLTGTPVFKALGLSNLALADGNISRETWERAFGRAARNMRLGVPIVTFGN